MAQIPHDSLSTGQKVWFRYSQYEHVNGPFKIKSFFGNHEGRHVVMSAGLGQPDRIVLLADDEDFGLLLFYDEQPQL